MRIVHVNFDYGELGVGGASIAAGRIHRGLLTRGVDSVFLCSFKRGEGAGVFEVPDYGLIRRAFLFAVRVLRNLPRLLGYKQSVPLNVIPCGMGKTINKLDPDVVMIHWVSADVISLGEIGKIDAPIIIVLHDLWFLLGCAAHPGNDTRLIDGFIANNSNLLERWMWERKKKLSDRRDICFVTPSKWATAVAKQSAIGSKQRCLTIPNPVDAALFRFDRAKITDHKKFTLLFGCNGGTKNPYKGFDELRMALEKVPVVLANEMRLLVFGESAAPCTINHIEVEFLGKITKVSDLVEVYHAADLFVFPSKEETQGQTKVEALSCGLPVVAFKRTACAEGIIHKETGWIAQDGDVSEYKEGILWWYSKSMDKVVFIEMRKHISSLAHAKYNEGSIIEQWLGLYHSLLLLNDGK